MGRGSGPAAVRGQAGPQSRAAVAKEGSEIEGAAHEGPEVGHVGDDDGGGDFADVPINLFSPAGG